MNPVPTIEYMKLRVSAVIPDPENPRSEGAFDPVKLEELAESFRETGGPIIDVRPYVPAAGEQLRTDNPEAMIICGERRWRAASLGKLEFIDCIMRRGLSEAQIRAMQLIENVQREDLTLPDTCRGIVRLMAAVDAELIEQGRQGESTLAIVAERLGKSKPWVSQRANVFKLRPEIQQAMNDGFIRDVQILHGLERLADLDPEEYDNVMESYSGDPEENDDSRPTREWLRDTIGELEEKRARQERAEIAAGPQPVLPKPDQLELTPRDEDDGETAPEYLSLPADLRAMFDDGTCIDMDWLRLLKRLRELGIGSATAKLEYDSALKDIRRQAKGEELEEPVTLDWLMDIVKQMESAAAESNKTVAKPSAAEERRQAEVAQSNAKRAQAVALKAKVDDFVAKACAAAAKLFGLKFDPGQIFNNPLSITSSVLISEATDRLPPNELVNRYDVRLHGTMTELGDAIKALGFQDAALDVQLQLKPAELSKVERALGRKIRFEYREELLGSTIDRCLAAARKEAKAKPKKGAVAGAGAGAGKPPEGEAGIGAFLKACTQRKEGARLKRGELHDAYLGWCKRHGAEPIQIRDHRWDAAVEHAHIGKQKSNGERFYTGVQLLVEG